MTKGVKICIAAVAALFVGAVAALLIMRNSGSDTKYVEIVQDNKVIYKLDLNEYDHWYKKIETADGGWNAVEIKDGGISVVDADCKDKTCCKMGKLKNVYSPIVCLPHKLVIRFAEDVEDE